MPPTDFASATRRLLTSLRSEPASVRFLVSRRPLGLPHRGPHRGNTPPAPSDPRIPRHRLPLPASRAALVGLLLGAGSGVAQEGAIAGKVVDAETRRAVSGAQVFLPGTGIGGLTGDEGRYRLEGVPAGEHRVAVHLIGYKDAERTVTVSAGDVTTADFRLEQTALRLQDIVVTGIVGGRWSTPRVKLPFAVEGLDEEDLPVRTSDISTLLAGKAAGMTVVQGNGQPGEAASIMLRGPTSIDARDESQSPLIVIDGVIAPRDGLADINSLDVDHIEIVKGAAASLYGSLAQNGVIQITTKRGTRLTPNTFDVTVRNEYGISELEGRIEMADRHPLRMNSSGTAFLTDKGLEVREYSQLGRSATGNPVLDNEFSEDPGSTANAFQDNPFPGTLRDHVDEFFDPGETWSNYAAASGRFGESSFRASFENFRETGIIRCPECPPNALTDGVIADDGYRRRNARLNVDARAFDGALDIAASGFYSNSTQDDAAVGSGALFSLTFMSPAVDLTETDDDGLPRVDIDPLSQEQNPLYEIAVATERDERQRVMGSLGVTYAPLEWLRVEGGGGYVRTDFEETSFRPKSEKLHTGGGNLLITGGSLGKREFFEETGYAGVTAIVDRALLDGDLRTRFRAGYGLEGSRFEQVSTSGGQLAVEGVPNFGAVDRSSLVASNVETRSESESYFLIGFLDYRGKYIVDALARRDGSSLFGPDERWHWYFRASGAYRVSQEEWWSLGPVDEFKLRYSYGTAGGRPDFFAQFETYGIAAGQVFPINLGNRDLKPEFTTEQEAGVNLVLFDRIGLDATYAWATTDDQILEVPQPGFVGFSAQWQNAGEIESRTIEASLRASIVDRSDVGWTVRANFDRTTQEITRLDMPAYTAGNFYVAEGEELGAIWGHRWATSCSELEPVGIGSSECAASFEVNDDGYLVWVGEDASFTDGVARGLWGTSGEVAGNRYGWGLPVRVRDRNPACLRKKTEDQCPVQDFLPLGTTTSDFRASFATNFRYEGLSVAGLLEASVGGSIYNLTEQWAWRDGSHRGADIDQTGKPEGLEKPLLYYSTLYDTNDTNSRFVQDGDWLKVRELSVGYTFPRSFLESTLGGVLDRMTLNLIGRNLLTFTDYTGYDPEVGFGEGDFGSAAIARNDAYQYPNFRTLTASLEVVF